MLRPIAYCLAWLALLVLNPLIVKSQRLGLDNLIYLNKSDVLSIDEYLSQRAWLLAEMPPDNDSIKHQAWVFNGAVGKGSRKRVAEVHLFWRTGEASTLVYYTRDRIAFDAIKAKILAYKMERQGQFMEGNIIGNLYYGNKYQVELSVTSSTVSAMPYAIRLTLHGLTKVYTENNEGKLEPEWRKLVMYGYKVYKEGGALIREQPSDTSRVLQKLTKGDLVIIPNDKNGVNCPECGDEYYQAWLPPDEKQMKELGIIDANGYRGYILKSELEYRQLVPN